MIDPNTGLETDDIEAQRRAMTHAAPAPAPSTAFNPSQTFALMAPAMAPPVPGPVSPSPAPVVPGAAAPFQPFSRERGSTTVTREKETKEEKEAAKKQEAAVKAQIEAQNKSNDAAEARAKQEQAAAVERQRIEKDRAEQQARVQATMESRLNDAMSRESQERQKLDKMELRSYWADRGTGQKVIGALAVALGTLGASLTKGPNTALAIINTAIDRDMDLQRAAIEKQSMALARAGKDVSMVEQFKLNALADVDRKAEAALRGAAAKAEELGAQSKLEETKAKTLQVSAALRAEADGRELKRMEGLRTKISDVTMKEEVIGGTSGGAAGKPATDDIKELNRLNGDIQNIDRLIDNIKGNPKAWLEYRKNQERWQGAEQASKGSKVVGEIRGISQGLGLANVAPEQGLKSDQAKLIHQGAKSLETSVAKGYGGTITEGDRQSAASEMADLAMSPVEKVRALERAKQKLVSGRDMYLQNRNVRGNAPQAQSAPSDSEAVKWAKANRKDPRAKEILRINGIE